MLAPALCVQTLRGFCLPAQLEDCDIAIIHMQSVAKRRRGPSRKTYAKTTRRSVLTFALFCATARLVSYLDPAMHRSAKRSRKAAKPQGETGSAQKAFATVGSAVRDGASTGLLSANLNVAPILFFTALVARDFWKSAPPLAAVPSGLIETNFEAGFPPPPPELRTKAGTRLGGPLCPARLSATRWVKLAWLAEVKGWEYTNASEFNGTLDRDLESARYDLLVKIKGEEFARRRQNRDSSNH